MVFSWPMVAMDGETEAAGVKHGLILYGSLKVMRRLNQEAVPSLPPRICPLSLLIPHSLQPGDRAVGGDRVVGWQGPSPRRCGPLVDTPGTPEITQVWMDLTQQAARQTLPWSLCLGARLEGGVCEGVISQ